MPVEKRKNGCYHVHNTTTKKCLSKEKAKKQLAAIEIAKHMHESNEIIYNGHYYKPLIESSAIMYKGKMYVPFDENNPIKGGRGDNTNPDPKELAKGEEVEKEHVGDLSNPINSAIAKDIARDHIAEFPDYYEGLDNMENALKKEG